MFRKVIIIALLFVVVICNHNLFSQSVDIPNKDLIKTSQEYRNQEGNVISMINWIASKESFDQKERRVEAIEFVHFFADNHPYISYSPVKNLNRFKKRSEYALQFKLGWINYVLEYEYSKNTLENHRKALNHVLAFYKENKAQFGRNSYLEKLKKLQQSNELDNFIKSEI